MGAELARDSGGSACINAECATAFASKGFVVYARSVSDAEKLCKRTQKKTAPFGAVRFHAWGFTCVLPPTISTARCSSRFHL
ncbi:hypothetical protein CVG87_19500 [Pseudomonas sp. WCS365]|nr:hypothetical protein CVG87_19500 [Pseudomonas sp. WCS365]